MPDVVILNTVGLNSPSKLPFRLHLRIFYISFHFLTELARYTSIADQEILLKFSFDAKRQIMTSQRVRHQIG